MFFFRKKSGNIFSDKKIVSIFAARINSDVVKEKEKNKFFKIMKHKKKARFINFVNFE